MEIDPAAAPAEDPSPVASTSGTAAATTSSGDPSHSVPSFIADGQKSNTAEEAEPGDEADATTMMMTVQDLCDYYSENSDSDSDDGASFHLGDDGGDDQSDEEYPTGRELLDVYSLDVLMKHYIRDEDDGSYEFEEDRDDDEMEEEETDGGGGGDDDEEEEGANAGAAIMEVEEGGDASASANVNVDGTDEEEQVDDIQLPTGFAVLTSHLMTVEDLREELDLAAKEARLRRYLTTVHDEEDGENYCNSGISIIDWKEDEGLPDEGPLRCRVMKVLHGTPLHYACSDTNGRRGLAKVRLVLDAARRLRIDPTELMTASMLMYEYDDDEEGLVLDEEAVAGGTIPIWTLINNQNSCCESLEALSEYWPQAAFLRNELGETTILRLIGNMAAPPTYQRNQDGAGWHGTYYRHKDFGPNSIDTLLWAASLARRGGGAEALVASTDGSDRMDMRRGDGCGEFGRGPNVLDLVCCNLDTLGDLETLNLPGLVRYFVKICPDLLLHCNADDTIHPFHKLVHMPSDDVNEEGSKQKPVEQKLAATKMKLHCAVALFEQSSTMAIAASLMRVDWDERVEISSGFRNLQRCLSVQSSDSEVMDATKEIGELLTHTILGRDHCGRSLLHYLAAWDTSIARYELSKIQSDILESRAFFQSKEADFSEDEIILMEAGIIESEERNEKDFVDVFSWICESVPGIKEANLLDGDGLNPLHFALANGKAWDGGMRNLTRLFPKWVGEKTEGLCPFMMTDDLTTSFELLRCAPGVVAPTPK